MHHVPVRTRAVAGTGAALMVVALVPALAGPAGAEPRTPGRTAAAALPVTTAAANARIARMIPTRLTAKPLGKQVSVRVADLSGGRQIFSKRAAKPRLPASNMKLVTAVTAMDQFGLDHRFPTEVVAQGAAKRKLVVVAGGDPVLTSTQLGKLANRTAKGALAALPSADPTPVEPPADPPAAPDAAQATKTAKAAKAVKKVKQVKFKVFFDDSRFAAPTLAPGWPASYQPYVVRPVRAFVRDGRDLWDTSTDAGRYFADQVRAKLAKHLTTRSDLAVTVKFRGRTTVAPSASPLASFKGNSLRAAVSWMLLVSDNDIAEMLYRNVAVAAGRPGSWAGGAQAAKDVLTRLGVKTKGLVLADGSGVSRADRLTSASLIQLLRRAAAPRNPQLNALRSMLPVSGVSGTLKASNGRYTTPPSSCARGKIFAKTGTLHDTVALSGYTVGADGRDKIFSVLVNNRPERAYTPLATRRAVDTIAATVTGCA